METKKLTVEIRQEDARDYPSVYDVNTCAFGRKEEARLVDRLRLSDAFIPELSMVATVDSKVVGYILFTKIHIVENENGVPSLALAPMAVTPDFQRKGVGGQLIRHGFDEARKLGYKSVVVLGHSDYYPRFGFTPTIKWDIKPPLNVPEKAFMGLELEEGSLSGVRGKVLYASEFGEF